jgi:hypothetical protein
MVKIHTTGWERIATVLAGLVFKLIQACPIDGVALIIPVTLPTGRVLGTLAFKCDVLAIFIKSSEETQ